MAASAGLYHWRPIGRMAGKGSRDRAGSWPPRGDGFLGRGMRQLRPRGRGGAVPHSTTGSVDALAAADGSVVTLDDQGELRVHGKVVSSLPPGRRLLAAESGAVLFVSVEERDRVPARSGLRQTPGCGSAVTALNERWL